MKIAVRRGHQYTGQDQGAQGIVKEIDVAERYYKLVIEGFKSLGYAVLDVTPPDGDRTLSDSLSYGINMANNWGADLFISCHVNNAYDRYKGRLGCEVIYAPGSSSGEKYATNVESNISNLGFKSRGAKADVRGLAELRKTNMPAIIVEPFFVEAAGDVDVYNSVGDEGIANAIIKGITGQDIVKKEPTEGYIISNFLDIYTYKNKYGDLFVKSKDLNSFIYSRVPNDIDVFTTSNSTGYWFETQWLPLNKCNEVANQLGNWVNKIITR